MKIPKKMLVVFTLALSSNLLSAQPSTKYTNDSPDDPRDKRQCVAETINGAIMTGSSGAFLGATLGSSVPAIGTGAGAIGGAILGGAIGGVAAYQECERSNNSSSGSRRTVVVSYPGEVDIYTY